MEVAEGEPVPSQAVGVVVQKFGGTSVADPERIREVADHVKRTVRRGDQVVVVVSAMGKETDELLHLASQVSRTRPGREMDMLITAGERKATALLCMALHDLGVPADSFTGSQAGFLTDTNHTWDGVVVLPPADPHAPRTPERTERIRTLKQAHTRLYSVDAIAELLTGRRMLPHPEALWEQDVRPTYDVAKRVLDIALTLITLPLS